MYNKYRHFLLPFSKMLQERIFLIASIIGYLVFYILTNPKSFVHRKLPKLKIKGLQLLPSVTVTIAGKIYHMHHWLGFSIILVVSIFVTTGVLSLIFTKGVLSGGIVQGIFTPKSFKLIYKLPKTKSPRYSRPSG